MFLRNGTIAALTLCSFSGCGESASFQSSGPKAFVDPLEVTIKSNAESEQEVAQFTIRNIGSVPFFIKSVTTSCGCTNTSVVPNQVLPGHSAILTAKITPINVGSKQILIEANTDLSDQPILPMRVNLLGTGEVPYVANSSNVIAFGNVARPGTSVSFFFQTKELKGSEPWLKTPRSGIDGITIDGGLKSERIMDSRVVARNYEFVATLNEVRSIGEFRGELMFPHEVSPKVPHRDLIQIHGFLVPVIQVSPGAIFGSFSKFEDIPTFIVSFRKTDKPDELRIEPPSFDPKRFVIEKAGGENGSVSFRLRISEPFDKELNDELVFRTGTDEMPEIRLPVRIRIRD